MTARLDSALAARGLARSRTHAAQLIAEGRVSVDGVAALKASARVADDATLDVAGADHYVSRAAHKLIAALDAFAVDPSGKVALDMGASTGGFTQVLRERGAAPVLAVDVGHDQLAAAVAADPEVRAVEGFNVRDMTAAALTAATGVAAAPQVVTGDLSFISLRHVLPAVAAVADPGADVIVLVKPQFEVGRTGIREGVVVDPARRADAVRDVLWSAWDAGFAVHGFIVSPLAGGRGNVEYLAHLRRRADGDADPSQWDQTVYQLAGAV